MQLDLRGSIEAVWIALGVLWGILWMARGVGKRSAKVQSRSSRLVHLGIMAMAFWLLFKNTPQLGPLNWAIVPQLAAIRYLGLAITCAGLAFTAWARLLLGRNWSAIVAIRQGHTLVRNGPYRWVRHPIYSGLLLAMLGTAICFGQARGLVALALGLIGFWLKAKLEEVFLIEQFGQEYAQYQKEVKALIPAVL